MTKLHEPTAPAAATHPVVNVDHGHDPEAEPVSSMQDLVRHFEKGIKPPTSFRIGLEHEKVGMSLDPDAPFGVRPLPYEDAPGKPQIKVLFAEMVRLGWSPSTKAATPSPCAGRGPR